MKHCPYCGYSPNTLATQQSDLCTRCSPFPPTRVYAFYNIAQQHKTRYPTDLITQGILLCSAKAFETKHPTEECGFYNLVRTMILEARAQWLHYETLTQRKWQAHCKNKNKARHHDSVAIREKYVRTGSGIVR